MKATPFTKVAGFSTLLLCSAVFADDQAALSFDALDQNQDGQLTATEASQDKMLSKQWTAIDKDENGTIDRVEFSAFEMLEGKGEQPQQPDSSK